MANGVRLYHEQHGSPADPAVLLLVGLGGQLHYWPPELVERLAGAGFQVVLMDNRDAGYSEKLSGRKSFLREVVEARITGGPLPEVPYLLSDMAADAAGLLSALDVRQAHLIGVSMGGMIAQTMAARFPDRVRTLTSIMSTTGSPDVGQATPEMQTALFTPPPPDRESAILMTIEHCRISWADHFDEERARQTAEESYDRGVYPEGTGRQLAAILASGDRSEEVRTIDAPTLVIHGEKDPLVHVSGGVATAEAIAGAELLILPGAGHDVPPAHQSMVLDRILEHLRSA